MNFKQKLLQRHKNPVGLLLRVITYVTIAVGVWNHNQLIISIALLTDLLNWFFMPMIQSRNEIALINKVVQIEVDFIKSPWNVFKYASSISGIVLFCLLAIGLWNHNWLLLLISFVLIAILKNLLLKTTNPAIRPH